MIYKIFEKEKFLADVYGADSKEEALELYAEATNIKPKKLTVK